MGDTLDSLLGTAAQLAQPGDQVYNQVAGKKTTAAVKKMPDQVVTTTTPTWQKYLPWGIGAVVVIVLGLFALSALHKSS